MTRIDTSVLSRFLAGSQSNDRPALQRLATGVRVGAQTPSQEDSAALSGETGGLNQLSSLLRELDTIVADTRGAADDVEHNQRRVDAILRSIDQVAGVSDLSKLSTGPAYSATDINRAVEQFSVAHADIPEGGSLDVEVAVTQSAQVGGFLLSFGGANIDLGAPEEAFVIEIAGVRGTQQLSFSSGTSVNSIAAAINVFSDVTGVVASSDGTGRLDVHSQNFGSDEFVSLRVVDDGDIAIGDGVFTLSATNTNVWDGNAPTSFASLTEAITDYGQDIQGTINGIVAEGRGTGLSVSSDELTARIRLNTEEHPFFDYPHAQRLGSFRAFTLEANSARDAARDALLGSPKPTSAIAPPEPSRVLDLLART